METLGQRRIPQDDLSGSISSPPRSEENLPSRIDRAAISSNASLASRLTSVA
jgi:hypothetical protein